MLRYFFDTEFIDDGEKLELISLGMVSEDGSAELYCINSELNLGRASTWVRNHVLPKLPGMSDPSWQTRDSIRRALVSFVLRDETQPKDAIELWSYHASYDWVVLCQLFGPMMQLPARFPEYVMDVKQYAVSLGNPKLPIIDQSRAHNALVDARWVRTAWFALEAERRRLVEHAL